MTAHEAEWDKDVWIASRPKLRVIKDLEQGSEEWLAARRGIVTASVVGKLVTLGAPDALTVPCPSCGIVSEACVSRARKEPTPLKNPHAERIAAAALLPPVYRVADNDTSAGLTNTLIAERISGWTDPTFMNDDMFRGVLHEPFARDRYAEVNGVDVQQVGFMVLEGNGFTLGASPDGLIANDGGLEIKCPRAKTHIRTILADEVPTQYIPQIQASLLVSGRKWWDFVSFCAGLPLYTKRVYPDPAWHDAITAAVRAFETTADETVAAYNAAAKGLPMTERIADDLEVVI